MLVLTPNTTLQKLMESDYTFYLTGSAYFKANLTKCNDLDFYVEATDALFRFLEELGFKIRTCSPTYTDTTINAVYTHPDGIDVQCILRANMDIKHNIQKAFMDNEKLRQALLTYNKQICKHIWQAAISVLE